jgi:signal transduction histidine kinase
MLRLRARRNHILAETNTTKDKFFNIISHDLKNPAVALRDALKLLAGNVRLWDTDTLSNYCDELLHSADGQVDLLNSLLGWAKLQTGRTTFNPGVYVLSNLKPGISLIRNMAEKKNITLIANIPDKEFLTCDGNMLETVIRNLLTNAVKFTAPGGTVTLEASPNPSKGGKFSPPSGELEGAFTFTVSDTGVGMNREQISNLFRLDKPQSRPGTADEEGNGLGLIVSKDLLKKHGCELHVQSEEGKGSRFWFELKMEK